MNLITRNYVLRSGLYVYTDETLAAVTARYAHRSDAWLRAYYVERTECAAGHRTSILKKLASFEIAAYVIDAHHGYVRGITACEARDYDTMYATEAEAQAVIDRTPVTVQSVAARNLVPGNVFRIVTEAAPVLVMCTRNLSGDAYGLVRVDGTQWDGSEYAVPVTYRLARERMTQVFASNPHA